MKYVWSTVNANGKLDSYMILECSEEIAAGMH